MSPLNYTSYNSYTKHTPIPRSAMWNVLTITAPLFSIIGLGFLLFRFQVLPQATATGLSKLVMMVCIPAVVISSLITQPATGYLMPSVILLLAAASVINFLLAYVVHSLIRGKSRFRRSVDSSAFSLGSSASTAIFIGFPIIYITHPERAVHLLVHFSLVQYLLVFPLGLSLCEYFQARRKRDGQCFTRLCLAALQRTLKNPIVIAIAVGFVANQLRVPVPQVVTAFVDQLAKGSGMLALLAVGGSLARQEEAGNDTCALCFMCTFKLLVHPLLMLAYGGYFLPNSPEILVPLVILTASPILSFFPAIAASYGLEKIASSSILTSYALSFLTINGLLRVLL